MKKIVLLAFDGATSLDLTGPLQVFSTASRLYEARHRRPAYSATVCSIAGGKVSTSEGLDILTDPLSSIGETEPDTLIVPGGGKIEPLVPDGLVGWIRTNGHRIRRICSVCVGAFILGKAGLLRGRKATTHWLKVDALRAAFPDSNVTRGPIFTRDGGIWTSAGVSSGIDLALHLVEDDLGHKLAMDVAKTLVVPLRRPSGQSQFSAALLAQSSADPTFSSLIEWIGENLSNDLSIDALATRSAMAPRTFARRFKSALGKTPADWVASARAEAARNMMEDGVLSIKEIAANCGFRDEQHLRRQFRKRYGTSPGIYRASFL